MSLEEMAKQYSEKWNVPIDEAKKQIQKFLTKKPGQTNATAAVGDPIFPDPLGPISKKMQDIDRAVLSRAFTRRTLKEMNQPPEELKTLTEKVNFMETTLGQMVELVNTTMKDMQSTLEAKKVEEEKASLLGEVAKIIQPLKDQIETLQKEREGEPGASGKLTPEIILETGKKMTAEAEALLKSRGYHVDLPKGLTLEEVKAKIDEALKVKKTEWEEKAGADVEIEKERIRATENMLSGVTDRIFEIFLEPIKDKIHEAIEKGAFARKRA